MAWSRAEGTDTVYGYAGICDAAVLFRNVHAAKDGN